MKKHLLGIISLAAVAVTAGFFLLGQPSPVKEDTYKISPTPGSDITLTISEPVEPVNVQAISASKAAVRIPDAYLKSAVHNCTSYEEWRHHVSDEYAKTLQVTEANFNEKKNAPRKIQKTGSIVHWVTASGNGTDMLYLVERVKYTPDLPEALAVRNFIRVKGMWVAHIRDELNLVGKVGVSDLGMLKTKVAGKGSP